MLKFRSFAIIGVVLLLVSILLLIGLSLMGPTVGNTIPLETVNAMFNTEPYGYAVEIYYGDEATPLLNQIEAFEGWYRLILDKEGWRNWIAKVAIINPANSEFSCLEREMEDRGENVAIQITDSGGYEHPAIFETSLRDYNYIGVTSVTTICKGMSLVGYVYGSIPKNQTPTTATLEWDDAFITIDFSNPKSASFPTMDDIQPKATFSIENDEYQIQIDSVEAIQTEEELDSLIYNVKIKNKGGYDIGKIRLYAIDNFGRFYRLSSVETINNRDVSQQSGSLRVAPGDEANLTIAVKSPMYPRIVQGKITSASVIVVLEKQADTGDFWFVGRFLSSFSSDDEERQ